jgi:hypothetical protein
MAPGSSGVGDGITNPRHMRPIRHRTLTLPSVTLLVTVLAVACGTSGPSSQGAAPVTIAATDTTAGAPGTTETTLPVATTTTITQDPVRKVMVVGDSTGVDLGPALTAVFNSTGADVAMAAGTGFGLTAQGISNLDSNFRTDFPRLLREQHPDLVVMSVGIWDQHFIELHGVEPYVAVVEEAVDILTSKGARILWLSMPPGGLHPERSQDAAFQEVAARHPGQVFYMDYEAVLHGPDGGYPVSYVAADGTTVHLRKADGWHFCPDGAQRVATEVNRAAVAFGLTVPAPDGWQDGSWRSSEHYDEPACRS